MGAYEIQIPPLNPPEVDALDGNKGPKNRYISFTPGNAGEQTGIRVILTDLPEAYEDPREGDVMWVGEPGPITEASGSNAPLPPPTFRGAALVCEPWYTDWGAEGLVHVYSDAIMPGATYTVQAIAEACDVTEEVAYSEPVSVSTSAVWGDLCGSSPCSPPNGVVDWVDISAVVDKFKNSPGSPIKTRADLTNGNPYDPTPDRKVDLVDISVCVGAFRGEPVPYPGPDSETCPPPVGDCSADIRVDSNNDGEIDGFDEAVEDTMAVFVVVNSDDDNLNEIPDWEETDVEGEDDLAELQLSAPGCASAFYDGWSLSWDVTAPVEVWWYSDKSCPDCPGGVAVPIENLNDDPEAIYPFSLLPWSAWLESVDTFDEFELTFTIYDGTGSLRLLSNPTGTKSDKVKAQVSPCIFGRKYTHVTKSASATGCSAKIRTRTTTLCGEPNEQSVASSNAWVGVTKFVGQNPQIWAQIGYARDREAGSTTILVERYAETKWGAGPTDYFTETGVPSGTHEYRCYLLSSLFGTWKYEFDGRPFHTFTHNNWRNVTGTHYQYSTEIFNKQDQMVGTAGAKCNYTECKYRVSWGAFQNTNITSGDLYTDDPSEWGIERVSSTAFNVWDKTNP